MDKINISRQPLTFEQRRILYNDMIKRRKQLFRSVSKSIKYILHLCYMALMIFAIGCIGGLFGVASEPVIYHFNKVLGLGYAHYTSYIESALVGMILTISFFNRNRSKEK